MIGLRLNADATLDFTTCERFDPFDEVEVSYYVCTDDDHEIDFVVSDVQRELEPGDVISLGATPEAALWDRLYVEARATLNLRDEPRTWELEGVFDLHTLERDEWVWQGEPPSTEMLENCALLRENP